ncbi:hypothetical protein NDU88_005529 [Pleurodeles waltl]|uniref:Gag protein n=1 Tax=Pleurodeles waltl TaxID=8319 RepID=A0AAV7TAW9_PLEWA|nr:hypothetical protein NDU88_005529 [Pleurodeles waltl]
MLIEFVKTRISPKNIDWQTIDRKAKESIYAYYERLLQKFKHYSGTETIEPKDMIDFVFRFVEGLRPEISQIIKINLIVRQAKPIDEVSQYAKHCSDQIKMKQRKLKEKAMVMQIKAAQTGMQGTFPQQQQQGTVLLQNQARGRGCGGTVNVSRSPDLNTVVVQNDVQGMKRLLPCHACRGLRHWKRECMMLV